MNLTVEQKRKHTKLQVIVIYKSRNQQKMLYVNIRKSNRHTEAIQFQMQLPQILEEKIKLAYQMLPRNHKNVLFL